MTTSGSDTDAKITDEGIERMKARIGVRVSLGLPFNVVACEDTIRHFAEGCGDDNPLWCDSEYGRKSRWGSVISSPCYATTMGISKADELTPEQRERGKGALAGVAMYLSGGEWEWYRPVRPGDKLFLFYYLYDVKEKRSQFGGGRSVITRFNNVYMNSRGELVAIWRNLYVHAERKTAVATGKYKDIIRTKYTPEMLKEIDDAYDREYVRGAEPRYWEDVQEGEELPPVAKGPMVMTEILCFVRGWGGWAGLWGELQASKLRRKFYKRRPKFFSDNEYGVPDVVERVHWDDSWAQQVGNPYAYDFGRMRTAWATNAITNWAGDEAWLWKMEDQQRLFNYIGDTTWVRGKVLKKYAQEEQHLAELELSGTNQRGQVTMTAHATVVLPTREYGGFQLPKVPDGFEGNPSFRIQD